MPSIWTNANHQESRFCAAEEPYQLSINNKVWSSLQNYSCWVAHKCCARRHAVWKSHVTRKGTYRCPGLPSASPLTGKHREKTQSSYLNSKHYFCSGNMKVLQILDLFLLLSLTCQDFSLFRFNLIWLNPLEIIDVLWERSYSSEGHLSKEPYLCLLLRGDGRVSAEGGAVAPLFWRNFFISWYIYNIHIHYFNVFQSEPDLPTDVKRSSWKQANNNF